jgi:hypothetical protein
MPRGGYGHGGLRLDHGRGAGEGLKFIVIQRGDIGSGENDALALDTIEAPFLVEHFIRIHPGLEASRRCASDPRRKT